MKSDLEWEGDMHFESSKVHTHTHPDGCLLPVKNVKTYVLVSRVGGRWRAHVVRYLFQRLISIMAFHFASLTYGSDGEHSLI